MKKVIICILISLLVLTGCNKSSEKESITFDVFSKKLSHGVPATLETKVLEDFYNLSPEDEMLGVYSEVYQKATSIYNNFALNFFNHAYEKNENEIISPYSIYTSLALLSNGASGDTRLRIENLLGMSRNDLNKYLKYCLEDTNKGYGIANALWYDNSQDQVTLKQDFIDRVNEYYGSAIYLENFKDKDSLVNKINSWSKEVTDGGIDNIVSKEDIDEKTVFTLLNGLTAGGDWLIQFDSNITILEEFKNYNGESKPVEMMNISTEACFETDKYIGMCKDNDASTSRFIALMPKDDTDIYDFINTLTPEDFTNLYSSIGAYSDYNESEFTANLNITTISLPKFTYKKENSLDDALIQMGIGEIYDLSKTDFSDMADGKTDLLYVQKIKQNDSIEVNEERFVASAVSVVYTGMGAGTPDIRDIIYHKAKFDKPFVYAIVDTFQDGKILFMGVYANSDYDESGLIPIEIIADDKIKVRNGASKNSDQYILEEYPKQRGFTVDSGDKLFAYEKKSNDGYTWYRIGNNAWIADQNGEWIKELN